MLAKQRVRRTSAVMANTSIHVGCSGWIYPHWRGRFYPARLPESQWFAYYACTFATVEINNSFYRLPSAAAVAHWRVQAPAHFLYAVKANRYLTHMKKLRDPEDALRLFIERVRGLKEHLGPLLYQLPPNWRCDAQRLRAFLALLPREPVHVFEFRHASWLRDDVFALLDDYGASLCVHDMDGINVPRIATGRVAYARFHGTRPGYAGGYPAATLRAWGRWLHEQCDAGRPAFAYFNNDAEARAVLDAQALLRALHRLE